MTTIKIHSGLTPKPAPKEPDWEGFRQALMLDDEYQVLIGSTNVPILAARLESVAMHDADNWALIMDLWTAVKGATTVNSEAPGRWNEMAKKSFIPLQWDSSGNISLRSD